MSKRLEAVELLGKLFYMRDCSACTEFPELFEEFLRRSRDQKASIVLIRSPLTAGDCASGTQGTSCKSTLPVRLAAIESEGGVSAAGLRLAGALSHDMVCAVWSGGCETEDAVMEHKHHAGLPQSRLR